jgi:anti-sigma regulatory factor (Ser/Thr protein kinase)
VRLVTVRLPQDSRTVPAARDALDVLASHVTPAHLEDARLLVSELVTNSLRHAELGPDDRIELSVDVGGGRVRIQVVDPGRGFAIGARQRPEGQGLGLMLLSRIADAWSITVDGETSVWFELPTV